MTRQTFALNLVQFLRKESRTALVRFEILLILAGNNDGQGKYLPMSCYQIMHLMGNAGPNSGSIAQMEDAGLLASSPGLKKGKVFHITTAGLHEVNRLLLGEKKTAAPPKPDMEKVAAATA